MQNIIDKIQTGDMTDNQLLAMLTAYHEKACDEYDEACTVVENNQLEINKLEANARQREENIKTIEKNALKAVDYARTLESDNSRLKAGSKELKGLRADNKKLKAQTKRQAEANKKAIGRAESLTKQWVDQCKQVSSLKSDVARLRLTGQKDMGKYSFSIFPSKISGDGSNKKIVCLMAHDRKGCMKAVTIEDGEVVQPRSHTFKFDEEQEGFIHDFTRIAEEDGHQFTDRVLSLVN